MMEKDRRVMIEGSMRERQSASEATYYTVDRRTYPAGQGCERVKRQEARTRIDEQTI